MLVIADEQGPVGLAGIMGGERTAVSAATTEVFLEVAWFAPSAIAGRARRVGLTTDASQRFERGVDPNLQERALERATELLLAITGGQAGPRVVHRSRDPLPVPPTITLRRAQLARLLGFAPQAAVVESRLRALGLQVEPTAEGWQVKPPAHRSDLLIEADLIEEVARMIGYGGIPETAPRTLQRFAALPESVASDLRLLDLLAARGYQEAIHFAFVDPALQAQLFPDAPAVRLSNPIADNLAVMRVSLWPGLLQAAAENLRRQQDRVRLFELGTVFAADGRETERIAGVMAGPRVAEQWGLADKPSKSTADFYDLRADVAALLSITGEGADVEFRAGGPGCLHSGRCATLWRSGEILGWMGELHPALVASLDLACAPQLFELNRAVLRAGMPKVGALSRQPQVRRDLALVVDEGVAFSQLRERVTSVSSGLLRELRCFDVYRGAGVESGRKSIALGLIFQDNLKTLTDEDADRLVAAIRQDLGASLNARIRE
jgi:phenylalanyl-tRNA synthetase beta chain